MFKNFIWDFDGTLVDTYKSIIKCYMVILKKYNIKEDENKILKMIKEISGSKTVEYLAEKYQMFTKEEFSAEYNKLDDIPETYDSAKPIEHAIEMCEYIKKKGYKNIVITNRRENVINILKKLDMDKYFDYIMFYGKDNVFSRKPECEMFDHVIKKFNLNIKETLSIGDRIIDYIASKKCGLPVCLFNTNYDKKIIQPEFDIISLNELKDIIDKDI